MSVGRDEREDKPGIYLALMDGRGRTDGLQQGRGATGKVQFLQLLPFIWDQGGYC